LKAVRPGRLSFLNCETEGEVRQVREQLEAIEATLDGSPEGIAAFRAAHPVEGEGLDDSAVVGLMYAKAEEKAAGPSGKAPK
jgi:hypothetical protein